MHILVLVLGAAVDDLDLVEVHEDAARHGHAALAVVLGRAEHGEDSCTLGQRHPLRVGLVGPNDVAALVPEQEAVNGGVAEAHRASASGRVSEAGLIQRSLHLVGGGVGPEAVRADLLGPRGFVVCGGHHGCHTWHRQDGLHLRGVFGHGTRNAPVNAKYLVVNDCGKRQPIERFVALFPYPHAFFCAKAHLALVQKRFVFVMLLPTVHIPRLVVTSQ